MLLSESKRRIFLVLTHAAVCRTDDLVRIDQLLQTVCTPADVRAMANTGVYSSGGRPSMEYTKPE